MDYIRLSKKMSRTLRHEPHKYGLKLDEYGFVDINCLLNIIRKIKIWENIGIDDINKVVETNDKGRFEIKGNKIRALYGHSVPRKIIKELTVPPDFLYHGTSRQVLADIKNNGLLSMNRQYVHLSEDESMAYSVGNRKDRNPIILKIWAKKAWDEGVKFYKGNDLVWLADFIDPKYIEVGEE